MGLPTMRVGLIARMDRSGLGQGQTLRLAKLLKPDQIMLIDSTPFNGSDQYPSWYNGYNYNIIVGFPTSKEVQTFLTGLDVVISCEIFYHNRFTDIANGMGVKTVLIYNYEFFDWFKPEFQFVSLPTKLVQPSYWHLDEMKQKYNSQYLPTPIFDYEFKKVRDTNMKRTGKTRYLFLNGKTAAHDRAGLSSLYEALQLSKGDFEVVVKAQGEIPKHPDPRLTYDFSNPQEQYKLYQGFDAMIHPRRYGGQSLPMCEALMSGLPVIMTDIDPNNKVLPSEWLVPATKSGQFMTRTLIDIYSADPKTLALRLDQFMWNKSSKQRAYEIGKQYEAENLRTEYEALLSSM